MEQISSANRQHAPSTGNPSPNAAGGVQSPAVSSEAWRVLTVSTLAFTAFFAVWVMFAIVGLPLRTQLKLTDGQFALLAAIPILTGSVLRVPVGMLTDIVGGRHMMMILAVVTAIPAFLISRADGYTELVALAFWLGLAGTSFSVGIPWVSAWFPAGRQGTALGVFGMGNVGASVTKLLAPTLVTAVAAGGLLGGFIPGGWRFVPFAYGCLMLFVALAIAVLTPRNDPKPAKGRSLGSLLKPLAEIRVWRFGYYYMMVFGAYVALSLWLPKYYVDVYDISLAKAGLLTSLFIFPASLLRPLGGWFSDNWGARRVTAASLLIITLASAALIPEHESVVVFTLLVITIGVAMGVGKASVYTYIPQYFPKDVGGVGGLVGAVGGIGGFILPLLFARAQASTGRPESTFLVLSIMAAASLIFLAVAVRHIIQDHHHHGAH